MRIRKIKACVPCEAAVPRGWRGWFAQILVQIETDDGFMGYGMGGGGEAAVHVINTILNDTLLGQDATQVEHLWEQMYRNTLPFGRKGIAIMAISGVDLALWDLRGRRENLSVAEVLGGPVGEPIRYYATSGIDDEPLYTHPGVNAYKLGGLNKYDAKHDVDLIVNKLKAARDLVGADVDLMVDVGMGWNDSRAVLKLCNRLEPLNIGWLEEPLPADHFDEYAWLRERSPIPIAGGEHEFTAIGFAELMRRGCHDIYQPDICWCGGMTEMVKIYRMAKDQGVRVCPHRGSETWGLHAIAALDDCPFAESGRPWMKWVGGVEFPNGSVRTMAAPGFNVDFQDRF